ncbi:MAG: putative metal-binding motif-containing protein [Alphaproteobacteria bacterium]|nr:putative metal-binding motif-containing protein [Alphaproteobacteria bacterium]
MRTSLILALTGLSLLVACVGFKDGAAGGDSGRDFDLDDDGYQTPEDCDDDDPTINPGGVEVCDALDRDEDCDGLVDDADDSVVSGFSNFWPDDDGDGYGDPAGPLVEACDAPQGYSDNDRDCDDADASRNPETGCAGGTYSGNITVYLDAFFFTDVCDGTIFVDVSERADPQVSGEGSCTFQGFFGSFGENHITLLGVLNNQNTFGDVSFSILDDTTFSGVVGAEQMTGSFTGTTDLSGYPVTYESSFTLQAR